MLEAAPGGRPLLSLRHLFEIASKSRPSHTRRRALHSLIAADRPLPRTQADATLYFCKCAAKLCDCRCGRAECRLGMWRFAPTPARRRLDAPCQPCRTMPAYLAPAFLWGNCVCEWMLPGCETKEADSRNIEVDSACSQPKPIYPSIPTITSYLHSNHGPELDRDSVMHGADLRYGLARAGTAKLAPISGAAWPWEGGARELCSPSGFAVERSRARAVRLSGLTWLPGNTRDGLVSYPKYFLAALWNFFCWSINPIGSCAHSVVSLSGTRLSSVWSPHWLHIQAIVPGGLVKSDPI